MLSEGGDPIIEDENENTKTSSETKSNTAFKSAKKLSEKNSKERYSHYESMKHPNMMRSDGTVSHMGGMRQSATSM